MRYLGIVGVSGSGKSSLMYNLIREYPSVFYKLEQCTTRDIRDDERGDAYLWLNSKRDFYKLEHLLIAKTSVRGELYGTMYTVKPNTTYTISYFIKASNSFTVSSVARLGMFRVDEIFSDNT